MRLSLLHGKCSSRNLAGKPGAPHFDLIAFSPKFSGKVGSYFTPLPAPILSKVPNETAGTICAQAFFEPEPNNDSENLS
jgi:hypothetical protein